MEEHGVLGMGRSTVHLHSNHSCVHGNTINLHLADPIFALAALPQLHDVRLHNACPGSYTIVIGLRSQNTLWMG